MKAGKNQSVLATALALVSAVAFADGAPARAVQCALLQKQNPPAQPAIREPQPAAAADPRRVPELGVVIASQGNAALREIHEEMRREMLASMRPALGDREYADSTFTGESRVVAELRACAIWTP
jgi:hypothetical protein